MKNYVLFAAVALLSSAAVVAHADHHKGEGKGRMTAEEKFAKIDADGNGSISKEEFAAHHAAKKAKWQEKKEKWKEKKDKMMKGHEGHDAEGASDE